MPLNQKQQRFVEEYVVDFNGKAAAIRAGYSKRSAAELAYQLLQKPEVAAAVKAASLKVSEATHMTAEDWHREMACIGMLDAGDVFDFTGETITLKPAHMIPERARRAISSIKIRRRTRVVGENEKAYEVLEDDIDITFHGKIPANALIGKTLGILKDHVEHSGQIDTVTMTDEERAAAVANMLKMDAARRASQGDDGCPKAPGDDADAMQSGGPDGAEPPA